jgi:hypothetical protein
MRVVKLIHWKPDGVAERESLLKEAGYEVDAWTIYLACLLKVVMLRC